MMYVNVTLKLLSPMLVGGKTLVNSFKESKPFIPGDVLRAAYAKAIVDRCPYDKTKIITGGLQRRYWVQYYNDNECVQCRLRGMCTNFADIQFPTLYPSGGAVFPMTARKCKYPNTGPHGCPPVVDILRQQLIKGKEPVKCDICESSYEAARGIHVDGHSVVPRMQMLTKTSVDMSRHTARQAMLYTVSVATELTRWNGQDKQTTFTGTMQIDDNVALELRSLNCLRVGAGVSKGYGKCDVIVDFDVGEETDVEMRVAAFNESLTQNHQWITVDLLSDAYLGLEKMQTDGYVSDDYYRAYLEKQIGLPGGFKLKYVYKDQESVRGFDTSKATEREMQRAARLAIKAGAVFVYEMPIKTNLASLMDLERRGIGTDNQNGFGHIRICDSFHTRFDSLKRRDDDETGTHRSGSTHTDRKHR